LRVFEGTIHVIEAPDRKYTHHMYKWSNPVAQALV